MFSSGRPDQISPVPSRPAVSSCLKDWHRVWSLMSPFLSGDQLIRSWPGAAACFVLKGIYPHSRAKQTKLVHRVGTVEDLLPEHTAAPTEVPDASETWQFLKRFIKMEIFLFCRRQVSRVLVNRMETGYPLLRLLAKVQLKLPSLGSNTTSSTAVLVALGEIVWAAQAPAAVSRGFQPCCLLSSCT